MTRSPDFDYWIPPLRQAQGSGFQKETSDKLIGSTMPNAAGPTFQDVVLRLQEFWARRGCVLQQPYDVEVGAGPMAPETFLLVLRPKPYKAPYGQTSPRPAARRYREHPHPPLK